MIGMRLQRCVSCRINGKEYFKYQVVPARADIDKLGWRPGEWLESKVTSRGLLIYPAEPPQQVRKTDYKEFKRGVTDVLRNLSDGCDWSTIRLRGNLPQCTPSPLWVKRMEDEEGLTRVRDPVTLKIIWRLPRKDFLPSSGSTLNGWTRRNQSDQRSDAQEEEM